MLSKSIVAVVTPSVSVAVTALEKLKSKSFTSKPTSLSVCSSVTVGLVCVSAGAVFSPPLFISAPRASTMSVSLIADTSTLKVSNKLSCVATNLRSGSFTCAI